MMVTVVVALVCTGSLPAPWPLRLVGLPVALLICLAISQRELLADPLGLMLGGTTGALLAFGLIWALLTGAEDANVDSQRSTVRTSAAGGGELGGGDDGVRLRPADGLSEARPRGLRR